MIIAQYSDVEHAMINSARKNLERILPGLACEGGRVHREYILNPPFWWQIEIFWSWFKYLQFAECQDEERALQEVLLLVTKNHYPNFDPDEVYKEARSVLMAFLYEKKNVLSATPEGFERFRKYVYSLYVALG